jgi:hypothetical protein
MVEVISVREVVFVVFALGECGLTAFCLTFSATTTFITIIMGRASFVALESVEIGMYYKQGNSSGD